MYYCHKCHNEVDLSVKPTRLDVCDFCGSYLRCCFNCKYYDESATNGCKEPTSAYMPDRSSGNFCAFWVYIEGKAHLQHIDKKGIKNQFDDLFKKK